MHLLLCLTSDGVMDEFEPFDAINVGGSCEEVPMQLLDKLKRGGRMVGVYSVCATCALSMLYVHYVCTACAVCALHLYFVHCVCMPCPGPTYLCSNIWVWGFSFTATSNFR